MSIYQNDSIYSLISRAFTFYKGEHGEVYVFDNNGIIVEKEDIKGLIEGLKMFVEKTDEQEIKEHNLHILNKHKQQEVSIQKSNKKSKQREGYVYFIKADNGLTKIGKAIDLDKRLDHFTSKLPYKLTLVHSIKTNDYTGLELELHKKFDNLRKRGEWFDLKQEHINDIKKEYGNKKHIA